jgi:hypothetical protein
MSVYKPAATWRALADQGKTWSKVLVYKVAGVPFDNTGYEARMMVRRNYDSTPVLSLTSSPNAGISLGGADGQIVFFVSAVQMEDLLGKYVFDLELYDPLNPAIVFGIVRGTLEVRRQVTYV